MSETAPANRPRGAQTGKTSEDSMLYAILAYHDEAEVMSWTPEADAAVMAGLQRVHAGLNKEGRLGPAARLGGTKRARTLRGRGDGAVIDGPFAETKEQLLGFYLVDFEHEDGAIAAARALRRANPGAVYEIRPVQTFLPGMPLGKAEAAADLVRL
jgi:hypothetical protein